MNRAVPLSFVLVALTAAPSTAADEPVRSAETVVTATRLELPAGALTAQATVLEAGTLRRGAPATTDDVLRRVPGFSLFRRSSSAVAHPTTQGVSLRGIGASGASRSLVLLDGMPLNDPFGGWVQWSKARPEALGRAEVLRGGAHAWGNYALSGVVSLLSRAPAERAYRLAASGGQGQSATFDLGLDRRVGRTALAFDGGYYSTDGYPVISRRQRGSIDGRADSRSGSARLRAYHPLGERAALFVQAGAFSEARSNGTPLTENNTRSGYAAAHLDWDGQAGRWTLGAFAQKQRFDSFFSAQASDRQSERPALDQFEVPATALGLSLEWRRQRGAHRLTAGGDLRRLKGETNESFFFSAGDFLRRRQAGGDQVLGGLFVHDTYAPSARLLFNAGLRLDAWRNGGGFRRENERASGDILRDDTFTDRSDWVLSPRLGMRYDAAPNLDLRVAAYRSFRAPTLNELYRPFRVGNDITAANPALGPERLTGAEAGFDYGDGPVEFHFTAYWSEVEDAVANLLIGPGPGQVVPCGFVPDGGTCRQRQGLGRTRSRGLELEGAVRLQRHLRASAAYLLVDSRIRRTAAQPELRDKRLPQIARHQAQVALELDRPDLVRAELRWRYTGRQYEDTLNHTPLSDFAVVDLGLSRILYPGLELFLRGENLFDRTYPVGISGAGVVSVGAPRRVGLGLRWTSG